MYPPVHDPVPLAAAAWPASHRRRRPGPRGPSAPAPLVREARGGVGRGAARRQRPVRGDGVRRPAHREAGPQRGHAVVRRPEGVEQPGREELASEGSRGRLRGTLRRGGRPHEEDAGPVQPVLPAARRPAPRLRRPGQDRGLPPRARSRSRGGHHVLPRRGRSPHPRGVRELSRPGDRPPRERGPPRPGVVHRAAREPPASRDGGRRRGGHRLARPGAEPRRPELPRRHEGRGPLRRRSGSRGHALHGFRAGGRTGRDPSHDARGTARGARGGRGGPLRLGGHELRRLRQVARARGRLSRRGGAAAAGRRHDEAVRGAARRARGRPRAPLRPRASRSRARRPRTDPRTSAFAPTATARTPPSWPSSSSTAATCSSRAPAPAPSPRTCRASGTRTCARRGARTGR